MRSLKSITFLVQVIHQDNGPQGGIQEIQDKPLSLYQ